MKGRFGKCRDQPRGRQTHASARTAPRFGRASRPIRNNSLRILELRRIRKMASTMTLGVSSTLAMGSLRASFAARPHRASVIARPAVAARSSAAMPGMSAARGVSLKVKATPESKADASPSESLARVVGVDSAPVATAASAPATTPKSSSSRRSCSPPPSPRWPRRSRCRRCCRRGRDRQRGRHCLDPRLHWYVLTPRRPDSRIGPKKTPRSSVRIR